MADYYDVWNKPTVTLSYSPEEISAGGGTSSPTVTVSQSGTRHWYESAETIYNSSFTYSDYYFDEDRESEGFTINPSTGVVTAESRGTTYAYSSRTAMAVIRVTGADDRSAIGVFYVYQSENEYNESWNTPTISEFSYPTIISAGGGTSSPTITVSQSGTRTYDSGATEALSNSEFRYRYSKASSSGFTYDMLSGRVTAESRGTTYSSSTRSCSMTVTVTGSGSVTATKTATCTQAANTYSDSYDTPTISKYSYSTIGAGGGTSSPSVTASQSGTRTYDSGDTTSLTAGSLTYSYSMTTGNGFSINTSTGVITAENRGRIEGDARSSNTATLTVSGNGKSSTTTTTATQQANSLGTTKYRNTSGSTGYNIVYTTPSCTLSNYLTSSGGSATVTCSVTNNTSWYQRYTSGSYTSQYTGTETGTARWMITSNGNSRFSHPSSGGSSLSGVGTVYNSGTSVSHSSMTTNATTDTVTVTAYNVGDTSKTKSVSASVTNSLVSISATVGADSVSYLGKTSITITAKYTSNSTKDISSSSTYSDTGSLIEFNKTENI